MSTLTDVLNNPASAAAELTRLRAENERLREELQDAIKQSIRAEGWAKTFDAEVDRLERRVHRLTWALRAIDTRLHADMDLTIEFASDGSVQTPTSYVIPARTLRQMCNVAVSATAGRPEGAA